MRSNGKKKKKKKREKKKYSLTAIEKSPSDSYLDLCLGCFCAGKEPAAHSKFHKYQVFSNLHFALFSAKWSAEEEMLLLEGLTLYGFGNW